MAKSLETYYTIGNDGPIYAKHFLDQQKQFDGLLKIGQIVKVTREVHYPRKTHQQCKLYFGNLVRTVTEELNDRGWTLTIKVGPHEAQVRPTTNRVKDLLYDLFAQKDDEGNIITISKMSTVQMAELYEDCVNGLAVEPWFIYVPQPDPSWKDSK